MPTVNLSTNPKKRNARKMSALQRYYFGGGKKKKNAARRRNARPVHRNAGTLTFVNKAKRRRNSVVIVQRPRPMARNPRVVYRYKRNPMDIKGTVESAVYAAVGGVLTRSIPGSMMSDDQNKGLTGYAANAATAAALSFAVTRLAGEGPGKMVLIGGVVMLIGRIAADQFGQNVVTFGQYNIPGAPKLSGDPAFNFNARPGLRGAFADVRFPIPYSSTPTMDRYAYPSAPPVALLAPPAPAVPAGKGKMGAGIWGRGNGSIWGR